MPYGEAAAEQHEKDQPSTCLRPDGASPELPPLKDRADFIDRMDAVSRAIRFHEVHQIDFPPGTNGRISYHAERVRMAEAKADQLVLMRAKQIVEEADERRRKVLERVQGHGRG